VANSWGRGLSRRRLRSRSPGLGSGRDDLGAGRRLPHGSDRHYPEAPAYHVRVSGFWIDCTPVINRQLREVVKATDHAILAEISLDPKDYSGAFQHMLRADGANPDISR
jgi:hypothetical protein